MSWPTTLGEHPVLMRKLAVHAEDFDPACAHTLIYAPCCGRRTAADTVVALHSLRTEISAANHQPRRDHAWACDGCLHLLILDESNDWTWSKLYRAIGAPPDVIRHYRAKEIALDEEQRAHAEDAKRDPRDRIGFNPGEAFERAYASLPAGLREIAGTERPDV